MARHLFVLQRFVVPVLNILAHKLGRRYPCTQEIGAEAYDNIGFIKMVMWQYRFTKTVLICLYDTGIRYRIIINMFCSWILRNKISNYS